MKEHGNSKQAGTAPPFTTRPEVGDIKNHTTNLYT